MAERGGARTAGEGKRIGRPPKPKVELKAGKGIASEVLAMDGPPDHTRKCECRICLKYPKNCSCREQCAACTKPEEKCVCGDYRPVTLTCQVCHLVGEHKVCHCEVCGWWELLLARDRRIVHDTRKYLTDRRDGKPAQGVFIGDTRESARELDFGDLPELIAPSEPGAARKPN